MARQESDGGLAVPVQVQHQPRDTAMLPSTPWKLLEQAVHHHGDRTAFFLSEGTCVTYRMLLQKAVSVADYLSSRCGVAAGTRVALLMRNSEMVMVLHYAIARLRAVVVNINTSVTSAELASQLAASEAQVLVLDQFTNNDMVHEGTNNNHEGPTCLKTIVRVQEGANHSSPNWETCTEFLLAEDLASGLPVSDVVESPGEASAADSDMRFQMYFTSGTTGLPKLIALTQKAVCEHAVATASEMRLHDSDVWLHA